MTSIFEPAARFARGAHKALEVDVEKLEALRRALDVARSVGNAAPITSLISAHASVSIDPENFWESEDGYAACHHLHHYIPQIVRVDGASIFGLDLLGEIYSVDLVTGDELIDRSKAVSPEWLEANPNLPFRVAPADVLVNQIDFQAGLDEGSLSSVSEAFDMGELGDDISGVGDFQVDALDDWAARLRDGLADLKMQLEDIDARDGLVLNWYEPR